MKFEEKFFKEFKSRIKFLFTGDMQGYNEGNNHISVFTNAIFKKIVLKNFEIKEVFYGRVISEYSAEKSGLKTINFWRNCLVIKYYIF